VSGRRDAVAAFWDEVVRNALAGGEPHRDVPSLKRWFSGYRGAGRGTVSVDASPEPYIGPLATRLGTPRLIALGLNPGPADLRFQGRSGVFAREHERVGGFSAWAVTEPYVRDPWRAAHGRNRYHENLRAFAQSWLDDPTVRSRDVLVFELYPWHCDAATSAMAPDPDLIEEFVWQPIAETGLPEVIAVGSDWQRVAERLGLPQTKLDVQFTDRTRRARAFELPSGQRLVVTWHQASNSPPNALDARALSNALRGSSTVLPSSRLPRNAAAPVPPTAPPTPRNAARPARRHPCDPFWAQLTARLNRERPTWKLGTPNRNDYPLFSPMPGARIKCNFSRDGLRVELLLQSNDRAKNLARLAVLTNHLPELQAAFGPATRLRPEPLAGKTQARLAAYHRGAIDEQNEWHTYLDWFIDTVTQLSQALAAASAIPATWPR